MNKTTKIAKMLAEAHTNAVAYAHKFMKEKALPVEEQTEQVSSTSVDFILGSINAQQTILEMVLMEQNCYHGFCYVDDKNNMPKYEDHNTIIEWSRRYIVR